MMNNGPHGLLLLNKKSSITSFDSVNGVRKILSAKKAGHTGTLDKFATGLLLVLVGKGVKLAPLFESCVKEYTGTVRFGEETDTLDPEGEIIGTGKVPSINDIEAVLDNFRGDILQAPPEYSAIHIKGRRAHELAREGIKVEMKKRPVTIHELKILSWSEPEAEILVRCSAGTYIRSLARDMALAAGSRAYLSALKRTKAGCFSLEDSVTNNGNPDELTKALLPLDRKIFETLGLPLFFIDQCAAEQFAHGGSLERILAGSTFSAPSEITAGTQAGVFLKKNGDGCFDELLGTLEYLNGKWSYRNVFAGH